MLKLPSIYCCLVMMLLLVSCAEEPKKISVPEHQQWHTITLDFQGPDLSEGAAENPFLNYRLLVDFKHAGSNVTIRGFYAADGNAAETSAESGNIWRVRFTPDQVGEWSYSAQLRKADSIALSDATEIGEVVALSNNEGSFKVVPTDKKAPDFRANGRLIASNGYFRFGQEGDYWMKGGANSPENLLAYTDFDNTYRMQSMSKDGEAQTNDTIHSYLPHLKDWKEGDPTWQNGKGKGLIGALNYLSSKGMNAVYFLTMNIKGDGKDVWPYTNPEDFTRFDVSKLEQWEIVFQHMQSKGMLLHVVLQETENEKMLDGGETGPMRQLYLREMVARFGHHLGLQFNLGEENGPAHFSPVGQNDAQRKAMIEFLTKVDPYDHPMLLHTHAFEPARADVLDSIVGFKALDGLSLQVDKREGAAEVTETWKKRAKEAGQPWLITMDEIGMWHTGVVPDSVTPEHDTLRRYVLWGTLLSGAAGVEWYYGARNAYNDLNTEDWRTTDRLWELTHHAITFFEAHLPYWEMEPEHSLINTKDAYCFRKPGTVYAIYVPDSKEYTVDLSTTEGSFEVKWFNPLKGGALQSGSVDEIIGGQVQSMGLPPSQEQDWVVLLTAIE